MTSPRNRINTPTIAPTRGLTTMLACAAPGAVVGAYSGPLEDQTPTRRGAVVGLLMGALHGDFAVAAGLDR